MSESRVAVVGSGPAGFYTADYLLEAGVQVDVLERLPTPWGLVRLGVAPDHPELKTASRVFEKTAAKDGFRFFGNVEVGGDVDHGSARRLVDLRDRDARSARPRAGCVHASRAEGAGRARRRRHLRRPGRA